MIFLVSLFTSSQPTNFSDIMDVVQPSVTEDMNTQLSGPFSGKKLK